VDTGAIGVANRLRFPHFPSQLGKQRDARLGPHATATTPNKGFYIDQVKSRFVE